MKLSDYDALDASLGQTNGKRQHSDIVFVSGGNCPLSLVPGPVSHIEWEVYDQTTRRSRRPVDGEKASKKCYLYGWDETRTLRAYKMSAGVAQDVWKAYKTALLLGKVAYVEVTATGTGIETRYSCNVDVNLPMLAADDWTLTIPADAKPLQDIADALLAPKAAVASQPTQTGDADAIAAAIRTAKAAASQRKAG